MKQLLNECYIYYSGSNEKCKAFIQLYICSTRKRIKTIRFPSDIHGIRIKNGKEEIKVICSDNEYHWVDFSRYREIEQ